MIDIKFNPKSNNEELVKAVSEYQQIWDKEGKKIISSIQELASLNFNKRRLEATIDEAPSKSHPLQLRASYSLDIKKATFIHELCHILLSDNNIVVKDNNSLEIHKRIYLILYDIWTSLYGENYAKKMVGVESRRDSVYKEAWEWTLLFKKEERIHKFREP